MTSTNLPELAVNVDEISFEYLDEEMLELMTCPICQEIFVEPMAGECQHTFCKKCINPWLNTKNSCPVCRENLSKLTNSLIVKQLLDKMKVICEFCDKKLTRGSYMDHIVKYCEKVPVKCIYSGCHEKLIRSGYQNHVKTCVFNCKKCICGLRLTDDIKNTHIWSCQLALNHCVKHLLTNTDFSSMIHNHYLKEIIGQHDQSSQQVVPCEIPQKSTSCGFNMKMISPTSAFMYMKFSLYAKFDKTSIKRIIGCQEGNVYVLTTENYLYNAHTGKFIIDGISAISKSLDEKHLILANEKSKFIYSLDVTNDRIKVMADYYSSWNVEHIQYDGEYLVCVFSNSINVHVMKISVDDTYNGNSVWDSNFFGEMYCKCLFFYTKSEIIYVTSDSKIKTLNFNDKKCVPVSSNTQLKYAQYIQMTNGNFVVQTPADFLRPNDYHSTRNPNEINNGELQMDYSRDLQMSFTNAVSKIIVSYSQCLDLNSHCEVSKNEKIISVTRWQNFLLALTHTGNVYGLNLKH